MSQDNPFVFATKEHILAMLDYGTGVIAFGFPACPHCHNAFPILERAFKEMHMHHYAGARGRILYYDILEDRAQNSAFYQTLVSYLSDYLLDDAEGNPRIFVPDVYFLVSGTVVGNHLGTVPGITDPREPVGTEQEAELRKIYKDLIEKVSCEC